MKKLFVSLLCVVMMVTFMPSMAFADGEENGGNSLPEEVDGKITLAQDLTLSSQWIIAEDESVVLDLNGKTLSISSPILVEGNLEVVDSTATAEPTIDENYTTVTYEAGKIVNNGAAINVINGGIFNLESGIIESLGNNAINVTGDESFAQQNSIESKANINGGYVHAREYGVGVYGKGAEANILNGIVMADDNAAVAGNGTVDEKKGKNSGGTTINIMGGTIIGHIVTNGYIACGVYHPQSGELNISGGTIYAAGGVGVLARAGSANITGGNIISTGNATGWVGDNKNLIPCAGIVFDEKAGYPGKTDTDMTSISGDVSVKSDSDISPVQQIASDNSEGKDKISITGGTFSKDVTAFVPVGFTGTYDPATGKLTTSVDENPSEGNEIAIAQDFNLWGAQHKGRYNVGWKYGENFNTDLITKIVVGIADEEGKEIVTYTADEEQLAYQRANGYINNKQSSAPFDKSFFEGKDDAFRDSDWTAVKGEAFEEFAAAKAFVEIHIGNNVKRLDYECAHKHTWGEWKTVTEATTTQTGLKERVCTDENCVAKQTEVIEKLPTPVGPPVTPSIQHPTIEADDHVKVTLGSDGTTATITVDEGYELADVVLNGVSQGKITFVYGLKTGDVLKVTTVKKGETEAEKNARLIKGVQNTTIRMYYKAGEIGKGWIKVRYKKSYGYKVDNYEIFRSTKKNTNFGKTPYFVTKKNNISGFYKNTKNVKKGVRHYYKMRGVREIAGETYYTQWSNLVMRTGR